MMFTLSVSGQRNIIEVPATDVVEYRNVFVQGQAAFSKGEINNSLYLTFGLGYNIEAGLTLNKLTFIKAQGLETNHENSAENPEMLINFQKAFVLTDAWQMGLGAMSGMSLSGAELARKYSGFHYINNNFSFDHGLNFLTLGVFYANDTYAGEGTGFGVMGGTEFSIIRERLNFQADVLSGNNDLSVVNTGFEFALPKNLKLTVGVQFPLPESGNQRALLLQLSYN